MLWFRVSVNVSNCAAMIPPGLALGLSQRCEDLIQPRIELGCQRNFQPDKLQEVAGHEASRCRCLPCWPFPKTDSSVQEKCSTVGAELLLK